MTPRRADWWRFYVGHPYLARGRDLRTGIDCWGLYRLVQREEFNTVIDDFGALHATEAATGVRGRSTAIDAELPRWRQVEWEEGAGVLFRVKALNAHIAIATATPGTVLHAHGSCNVDLLNFPASLKWKDRFAGCYLPA